MDDWVATVANPRHNTVKVRVGAQGSDSSPRADASKTGRFQTTKIVISEGDWEDVPNGILSESDPPPLRDMYRPGRNDPASSRSLAILRLYVAHETILVERCKDRNRLCSEGRYPSFVSGGCRGPMHTHVPYLTDKCSMETTWRRSAWLSFTERTTSKIVKPDACVGISTCRDWGRSPCIISCHAGKPSRKEDCRRFAVAGAVHESVCRTKYTKYGSKEGDLSGHSGHPCHTLYMKEVDPS